MISFGNFRLGHEYLCHEVFLLHRDISILNLMLDATTGSDDLWPGLIIDFDHARDLYEPRRNGCFVLSTQNIVFGYKDEPEEGKDTKAVSFD